MEAERVSLPEAETRRGARRQRGKLAGSERKLADRTPGKGQVARIQKGGGR